MSVALEIDMDKSHCPLCNTKLEPAPKEQLKDKLEPNTYHYYDRFWRCPNCGQIYWQGAHWKQITNTNTSTREEAYLIIVFSPHFIKHLLLLLQQ